MNVYEIAKQHTGSLMNSLTRGLAHSPPAGRRSFWPLSGTGHPPGASPGSRADCSISVVRSAPSSPPPRSAVCGPRWRPGPRSGCGTRTCRPVSPGAASGRSRSCRGSAVCTRPRAASAPSTASRSDAAGRRAARAAVCPARAYPSAASTGDGAAGSGTGPPRRSR